MTEPTWRFDQLFEAPVSVEKAWALFTDPAGNLIGSEHPADLLEAVGELFEPLADGFLQAAGILRDVLSL